MTPKEIIEKAKQGIIDKKEKELNNKQISGFVADMLKPYLVEINKTMKESVGEYIEKIKNIQLLPPSVTVTPNDVNVPEAKVTVDIPEIKIPEIKMPEIKIDTKDIEKAIIKAFSKIKIPDVKMPTIKIPEIKIPKIEMPEIKMPKSDEVQRIILVDPKTGKDYKAQMSSMSSGGGGVVSMRPLVEVPAGYEQLTVSSTAIPFASIPDKAGKVVISIEDATIRYRDDGTAPTTTVGMVAYPGTVVILNSKQAITKFKAIRTGASDAELNCLYYEINE